MFPNWKTLGKHACAMNVSGKMTLVLLTFIETDRPEFSPPGGTELPYETDGVAR